MDLDILKGTRDQLPETQIPRARVAEVIRTAYELFGFSPAETPVLNYWDVLSSKYAGGAEILKETYRLTDQGGRDIGLRYDLTVPFARMVGMYRGGAVPSVFRRYEIGRVFRNGPVKTGRLREFTQCDGDVVTPPGVDTAAIDAEFLAIGHHVFAALGIDAYASVNDRRHLAKVLAECGVPADRIGDAVLSVDKFEKIGVDGVAKDLAERGLDPAVAKRFHDATSSAAADGPGDNGCSMPAPVRELFTHARQMLVPASFLHWSPGLARGLEIYTGTVFEFFWRDPDSPAGRPRPNPQMSSSMAAGGRYDKIIGQFLHPDEPARHESYPAAGMSFGLDVLTTVMGLMQGESAARRTVTEVSIFPFGPAEKTFALQVAGLLRSAGVRCEVDHAHRRIKHSVEHADKMRIPFHAAIGGNEVAAGAVMIKHLSSGEKQLLAPAAAAEWVKSKRG